MFDYIKSFDNSNEYDNYKSSPLYVRPNVSYIWDKGVLRTDIVVQSGASGTFPNLKGGLFENAVVDYEGNFYDAVILGEQVWMANNLRTKHYADGTSIPKFGSFDVDNDSGNTNTYGLLYDDRTINRGLNVDKSGRIQGIAPNGWHIPSVSELRQMLTWVGQQPEYLTNQTDSTTIAKALASNSGWTTTSSYSGGDVPCNQPQNNNKTKLNVQPLGIWGASGYYERVTEGMTDWTGDYLIGTENGIVLYGPYIYENFMISNNYKQYTLDNGKITFQARSNISGYYTPGNAEIHIEKYGDSYVMSSVKTEKYIYHSLNSDDYTDNGYAINCKNEIDDDVIIDIQFDNTTSNISIYNQNEPLLYISGSFGFCSSEAIEYNNTQQLFLYKQVLTAVNGTGSLKGQYGVLATTDYIKEGGSANDALLLSIYYFNSGVLQSGRYTGNSASFIPVRCLYNGTVEEFIKNYRNLNP